MDMHVATHISDSSVVDTVNKVCVVAIMGYDTWVVLIVLDMVYFDAILGMD